jgi:hypothetical protein
MRGSLVVLALAVTPFVARVSRAQDDRREERRETRSTSRDHDHDHDHDKKCEDKRKRSPWENLVHREDSRDHDKKDCSPTPTPPPQSPPPSPPPPPPTPPPTPTNGVTSISGSLFHDLNRNGVMDPEEIGLAGWQIQLSGPVTQMALSDGNGSYTFTSLPAGTYTVCVLAPAGWDQTLPTSGLACELTLGYSVVAPALAVDSAVSDINFGFLSVP